MFLISECNNWQRFVVQVCKGGIAINKLIESQAKALCWADSIPDEQWDIFKCAIRATRNSGVPFVLGGAFSLATYTGRWRNTKDLDFFIQPTDRDQMVQVLSECGFRDYYDELPYERHWIYRSVQQGIIVDVIWQMANRRAEVDEAWISRATTVVVRGEELPVLPAEEMLWGKLYVMQRERCDWGDVWNLIAAIGPSLDWDHLLVRLGEDVPLLRGALAVFEWLAPEKARELPADLWAKLRLPSPEDEPDNVSSQGSDLLDTRRWFYTTDY